MCEVCEHLLDLRLNQYICVLDPHHLHSVRRHRRQAKSEGENICSPVMDGQSYSPGNM
jgi:hypothetical protein